METWEDVIGFEGLYQVSDMGRVKSFYHDKVNGRLMQPSHDTKDYLIVTLYRDGKRQTMTVHRLVAERFLGPAPSPKHEINHKNGVKDDPRLDNLEWVTSAENHKHAAENGLKTHGKDHHSAKLTGQKATEIRSLYATGDYTMVGLGKMFGITKQAIWRVVHRETWQHVP